MNRNRIKRYGIAAALAALIAAAFAYKLLQKKPLYIGTERQFIWNESLIDQSKTTASYVLHSPEKQSLAIALDSPWEAEGTGGFNIAAADDGSYKMYYIAHSGEAAARLCYAQSADGISWEKPQLGLADYNGSTENNILLDSNQDIANGFFVFLDSNENALPDEKYKAIAVNSSGELGSYTSPDGIHWNKKEAFEKSFCTDILSNAALCSAFWHEKEQRYFCYYIAADGSWQSIMLTTSKDFHSWSKPKKVQYQGGQSFNLQTANLQLYERAENAVIGLPLRITNIDGQDTARNFTGRTAEDTSLTDTIFLSSADGKSFRSNEEAWLAPGAQNGSNWLFGDCFTAGGMAQTPSIHSENGEDDELSFYVAENILSESDTRLLRYTLRMDGFASYNAPFNTKKVVTKPLVFDGSRMILNFKTSTDGYVVVKILDENGQPFEDIAYTAEDGSAYSVPQYTSYKMIGDRIDREVAFNADLTELKGKTVVLEFTMSDADIYSFCFDNEDMHSSTSWQPEEVEFRNYDNFTYDNAGDVINIGTQRQVLWDDYIVDTVKTDAALVSHSPVRRELLFKTDLPWEGDNCDFYVIFDDEDEQGNLYHRMYYLGWDSEAPEDIRVCYAYSYDGIEWVKPDLGLHSFTDPSTGEVYTQTNIVLYNEEAMFDNFFVMKDPRPNVPDSQRYKAICQGSYDEQGYSSYGLWGWVSPDGLHWTKTHRQLPQLEEWFGAFDSVNGLVWDDDSQQFFTYFRVREKQLLNGVEWPDFRKIYGATGKEFEPLDTDTIFALNYGEDAPLFEMYTNNISKYYRAPQMFIGFPTRFSRNNLWKKNYDYLSDPQARREKFDAGQETKTLSMTDAMFMTSRDGYTWNRQNEAYITPGPEYQANWIYGNCYPAYGLVETKADEPSADNELSMYLFEGKFYHEPSAFYRYTLRLDGFKSYKSTYSPQKVKTKPLTFSGSELLLNFKTSAAGSIEVSILNENGDSIEGYSSGKLIGDQTDREIVFDKSLSELNGTPVILQFTLSDAELYSFKFQ